VKRAEKSKLLEPILKSVARFRNRFQIAGLLKAETLWLGHE